MKPALRASGRHPKVLSAADAEVRPTRVFDPPGVVLAVDSGPRFLETIEHGLEKANHATIARPAEAATVRKAPAALPRTVLLVEDEEDVRKLLTEILAVENWRILASNGPRDALELSAQHDGKIDLLLSDVMMPEMNGCEMGLRMAEKRPGMRMLFMSGYAQDALDSLGRLGDKAHFIPKPFRPRELTGKIREILES